MEGVAIRFYLPINAPKDHPLIFIAAALLHSRLLENGIVTKAAIELIANHC